MCGFLGTVSSALMHDCLMALGFSAPCVTIWEFNILNTKQQCFEVCLLSYITSEPNNKPDGSLNDCLQCDEDKSGPNFKYFSGRTRYFEPCVGKVRLQLWSSFREHNNRFSLYSAWNG